MKNSGLRLSSSAAESKDDASAGGLGIAPIMLSATSTKEIKAAHAHNQTYRKVVPILPNCLLSFSQM